jgi:hypothetical protein
MGPQGEAAEELIDGYEIRANRARAEGQDVETKAGQLEAQQHLRLAAIGAARDKLKEQTDEIEAQAHRAWPRSWNSRSSKSGERWAEASALERAGRAAAPSLLALRGLVRHLRAMGHAPKLASAPLQAAIPNERRAASPSGLEVALCAVLRRMRAGLRHISAGACTGAGVWASDQRRGVPRRAGMRDLR